MLFLKDFNSPFLNIHTVRKSRAGRSIVDGAAIDLWYCLKLILSTKEQQPLPDSNGPLSLGVPATKRATSHVRLARDEVRLT